MIDTVRLRLQDFSIVGDTKLIVQSLTEAGSGHKINDYHLWTCADTGEIVQGCKAYFNDNRFNITFLPNRGCFLSFSMSRLCHNSSNNYFPVKEEDCRNVIRAVERDLGEIGIMCDINRAKLSRLDSFKNVVTEECSTSYYPVLLLLSAKRMHKKEYGTCFLWQNTRQEICIYDKIAEMRYKMADVSDYPENVLRFEHRLLTSSKISEALAISSVEELLGNYGGVERCFISAMENNLFSHEVGEAKISTKSETSSHLLTFKERYGRQGLDRYFRSRGINDFIEEVGTEVALDAVLHTVGNKMGAHRYRSKFEQAALDMMMLRKGAFANKTLAQLYEELRRKLLQVQ